MSTKNFAYNAGTCLIIFLCMLGSAGLFGLLVLILMWRKYRVVEYMKKWIGSQLFMNSFINFF